MLAWVTNDARRGERDAVCLQPHRRHRIVDRWHQKYTRDDRFLRREEAVSGNQNYRREGNSRSAQELERR